MKKRVRILIMVTAVIIPLPAAIKGQDAASRPIEVLTPTPTPTPAPKPSPTPKPTSTPEPRKPVPTATPVPSVATAPEAKPSPAETVRPEKKAEPVQSSEKTTAAAVEKKPRRARKTESPSQRDEQPRYDRSAASTLKSLEREWEANFNDSAIVDQVLADDFVGTSPDGKLMSKRALLQEAHGGAIPKTTAHNLDVHFYAEDVAVVTGRTKQIYRDRGGRVLQREYRFTDTWVHRGGRWRCVASQSTLLPSR
jgi:ketosteroid isomerase-like protein